MKKCDCPRGGGPAFPTPTPNSSHGMSLRDYFAGQALEGFSANPSIKISSGPDDEIYNEERHGSVFQWQAKRREQKGLAIAVAEHCYFMAAAMLKARSA